MNNCWTSQLFRSLLRSLWKEKEDRIFCGYPLKIRTRITVATVMRWRARRMWIGWRRKGCGGARRFPRLGCALRHAHGYYCTNNFKTDYQFDPPITAWDKLGKTAHWRDRRNPEQPFFSVFNFIESHESGMWPEKGPEPRFDPRVITLPPYFLDTPKVREAMARMYTNIEDNDGRLGLLLRELEEDGLAENTIVFHWSDHSPLPRGKRWPYDSGIHVPLIVRWPGQVEPGSVNENLVSTIDLGPTVLSVSGIEIPAHMQGRAFLGPQSAPPREYVYASRDRHDEAYDRVRAVRDRRFKYMRNYYPEKPYLSWIPYRNRHPIMQEMWRLYREDMLKDEQLLMFQSNRPVEELYDTESDPYETRNLAADPAFREQLERLRGALDAWLREVGDMGELPEAEMVRRWYPGGKQPITAAPIFVPICEASPGIEAALEGGFFKGPVLLQLHSATEGASIAYTSDPGNEPDWQLYTAPLRLPGGETTIRAKAVRIGYQNSLERRAVFRVEGSPYASSFAIASEDV